MYIYIPSFVVPIRVSIFVLNLSVPQFIITTECCKSHEYVIDRWNFNRDNIDLTLVKFSIESYRHTIVNEDLSLISSKRKKWKKHDKYLINLDHNRNYFDDDRLRLWRNKIARFMTQFYDSSISMLM